MSLIVHNAIIVTGYDQDFISDAREEATSLGLAVSEVVKSPVNGYISFFVAPDGSKEGWETSDEGDAAREKFCKFIDEKCSGLTYAEIRYGNDSMDTPAYVIRCRN